MDTDDDTATTGPTTSADEQNEVRKLQQELHHYAQGPSSQVSWSIILGVLSAASWSGLLPTPILYEAPGRCSRYESLGWVSDSEMRKKEEAYFRARSSDLEQGLIALRHLIRWLSHPKSLQTIQLYTQPSGRSPRQGPSRGNYWKAEAQHTYTHTYQLWNWRRDPVR